MPDYTFRYRSGNLRLRPAQPALMGILNLTPDSFSDGGRFTRLEAALEQARQMQQEGAACIDIGGESTRPGFQSVSADEECRRLLPFLQAFAPGHTIPLSIDTSKAVVAAAALAAGADIINDVSAMADPNMAAVLKEHRPGIILMHNHPIPPDADPLPPVLKHLQQRLDYAMEATGLPREHFIVDPGLGFGKTWHQNLQLLRHGDALHALGCPLLQGFSNKSFIGRVSSIENPADRIAGNLGAAAAACLYGAEILRMHQIAPVRQALQVFAAIHAIP